MYDAKLKDDIFNLLINCEIGLYTSYHAPDRAVVSISNIIALLQGVTKYGARMALKSLVKDGLIEYTSQGHPALVSYGEVPELIADAMPPTNGYALTRKAFNTPEWKQAYKNWCKSMEEWANADMRGEDGNGEDT